MNQLVDILRRVEAGESTFRPADSTVGALQAFQPVARALAHAKREKLIGGCELPMESVKGRLLYSAAYVVSGLTYKGAEFLRRAATFQGKFVRYGVPALKWVLGAAGVAVVGALVTRALG